MTVNTIIFKDLNIFPELFLGIALIYLLLHCTFLSSKRSFPLIQNSVLNLSFLVVFFTWYLLFNNDLCLGTTFFNDTVVNDYLSYGSKSIVLILSALSLLVIQQYLVYQKLNDFEYALIVLFSVLGLLLLCSANDLITAYLAIELQSLAFYVLAAFKKSSSFSVEAGIKYFILGALSSSFFLLGSSFLYGFFGTVNLEDFKILIALFKDENFEPVLNIELAYIGLMLIFSSLLFKLAVAPFHVWAPSVYEGSPTSSSLFFSVVPKIAIFTFLVRLFYHSFEGVIDLSRPFLVLIILFTVIVGSFGGLEQRQLKSLLVYSAISHMGYSLIAFSTGTKEGLQFLFSYLLIYSFSGLCLWAILIFVRLKTKNSQKQSKTLSDFSLLAKSNVMLGIFFSVVLFSLAGFPPMIGFVVKFGVFLSAMDVSMYFIALVSILCSVIATFYYIRIIKVLFFENCLVGKLYYPISTQRSILLVSLFYLTLFLFCNPKLLFLFSYKMSLLI